VSKFIKGQKISCHVTQTPQNPPQLWLTCAEQMSDMTAPHSTTQQNPPGQQTMCCATDTLYSIRQATIHLSTESGLQQQKVRFNPSGG
jgi:hypothetical protein